MTQTYQSKRIKEIIEAIDSGKLYLPAIQRKFVWQKSQIQLLFDSIMRNYPIGTFLFWVLKREKAHNYVFYEFLKEYDERNPFNRRKIGHFPNPEIIGVLDGQQRLSSMYIGLQGTHTERARYKRRNSDNAYDKTCLYLNILSLPYYLTEKNTIGINDEKNFEFRFLTEINSKNWIFRKVKTKDEEDNEIEKDESMFWLKVEEVLKREDPEFDEIINVFVPLLMTFKRKKLNQIRDL